jgi:hypothetical protein
MSRANALWGAPRIHGELLKLGIEVSQATVSKYMVRHRKPPSQSWRTFLTNHAKDITAICRPISKLNVFPTMAMNRQGHCFFSVMMIEIKWRPQVDVN